jgi:phosphoglycerate kinase
MGASLVSEEAKIEECRRILAAAEAKGVEILLPTDHLVSRRMQANARAQRIDAIDIPKDLMGLDIGPATAERYVQLIERAQTVIWNGPMGKFEFDAFSGGTVAVARAVANNKQLTIVGGGDTIAALKTAGVKRGISHVSTGGGAMLNFLANKSMPGIEAIEY